ncbi:MAG: enoyl-CoA hydratase/isomerase family protein [Alphaproteobacteria bacterium]|nr:enoyl-CoA hydratase/isomerase family protein [Alphaproteobacteria bacterium]
MQSLREAIDLLVRLRGRMHRAAGRVSLDLRGEVAELVIDNPGDRHAMTLGMMEDLGRSVLRLTEWRGSVVILRSSSREAFCSGAHLDQVREALLDKEKARHMAEAMTTVMDGLLALPQVSVAVVSGPAVGGGAELCTATDHRVFHAGGWVQFRQAALGVGAGWGGARRLLHHVPSRVALRWLTTAGRIDARLAGRVGFADVVTEEDPHKAARDLVAPLLALPAAGVRTVKAQLAYARLGSARERDVDAFVSTWGGPDHRKALGLPDPSPH